jgi:nitrous oxidase accessory protein
MARRAGTMRRLLAAGLLAAGASLASGAPAATLEVPAGGDNLRQALESAAAGDVLRLRPGTHLGGVTVTKPLTLEGEAGAVVDGGGKGQVIRVSAPDVTLRGLTVRGSGGTLATMDAGILLDRSAERAVVEDNTLEGNLFGIYVWGAAESTVRHNRIQGNTVLRTSEAGDGIALWNSPGVLIADNQIVGGRDGIFVNTSRHDRFIGNRMSRLRFGIHYMYANDSEVSGNVSQGNHIGFAIMFSERLAVRDNVSEDDREHGLMFNYANDAVITGNVVRRSDKCVFIYNANKNRFEKNWFEGCGVGIHFTAGSERNVMTGNAFIRNRTQVMYVGTRSLDWSEKGRGNYWSDNAAFDLNGDGIADTAYRPNDVIDKVQWSYPTAKLLMNSPAVQVIRWAQSQFPALHPGGVIDSAPLMQPSFAPPLDRGLNSSTPTSPSREEGEDVMQERG